MKFYRTQGRLEDHQDVLPMKATHDLAPYRGVGIDVSKAKLDVYDLSSQRYDQYDNSEVGIAHLVQSLLTVEDVAVVCESTGGYESLRARRLHHQGIRISVVNPRAVSDLAKGFNQLAKTDRLDAKMIATYGAVIRPKAVALASATDEELQGGLMRRRQLVEMLGAEKNRRQQLSHGPIREAVSAHIDELESRIQEADQQIKNLSESNAHSSELKTMLLSVKGIGPLISSSWLVLLLRPWWDGLPLTEIAGRFGANGGFGVDATPSVRCLILPRCLPVATIHRFALTTSICGLKAKLRRWR